MPEYERGSPPAGLAGARSVASTLCPCQPTDTGRDPRSSVAGATVRWAEAHDETRRGVGATAGGEEAGPIMSETGSSLNGFGLGVG